MSKLKIASLAVLAVAAAAMPASAQSVIQYVDGQGYGYRTEPLYPYVVQPQYAPRAYPYVSSQPTGSVRSVSKVDPALVEELRKRRKVKASADEDTNEAKPDEKKITKTIVVREKPVVRNTYRVVDNPPIIVQREISEDQVAEQPPQQLPGRAQELPPTGRIIRAEAEITILGPDRMNIRLFRKRDGSDSNAEATGTVERKAELKGKSKIR